MRAETISRIRVAICSMDASSRYGNDAAGFALSDSLIGLIDTPVELVVFALEPDSRLRPSAERCADCVGGHD